MKKTFFAAFLLSIPLFAQTPTTTTTPPPTTTFSETMDVAAIRADEEVPVTKTDIPREEIEQRYHGQDVPLLMRDAPSINAHSESGVGGAGYSYITLRGIGASRINFTLDGVPLADSEDMGAYFVDFPDLARSLQTVQIQRGVGTSTFGSPSFAGSVNLESIDLAQDSRVDATLAAGSFGNQQVSVGYHSGALPGGFQLYTRLSYLENEGFRDNSATRQRNFFFSGTKQLGEAQLKLTGFAGHEDQQLSFYATDEETLKNDPHNNPLRPEEKDSFGYDLAQLQYIRPLSSNFDMTASAYYQRGYGWFRLFDSGTDNLRELGLDGMLLGSIVTFEHRADAITTNYGFHVNRFRRDHTRDDLVTGTRNYANYGVKDEINAFAKVNYELDRWNLYGDAQVRRTSFDYHGDVDLESIDWTFFNPKVGARYSLTPRSSVYASVGISSREPARADMFLGEDNPSIPHDLHAVKPERVLDFEAGWRFGTPSFDFEANVYAMEFHDEIAATGELNEIGLALRRNVDRSHRRGIELDAAWRVSSRLRSRTTASFSHNRIEEWTQFFDVYDVEGNYVESRPLIFDDVEPLLTPSVIITERVDYAPTSRLSTSATARYVGGSYLDNTNDSAFETPSFFLVDASVSYAFTSALRVTLQVNNLLDADRIYPNGYSYRFFSGEERTGTAYYYPQATRNAVVLLDFDL